MLHNLECFFLHSFQSGIFHSSHLSLNISSEEYSLISPLIIRYYNSLLGFFCFISFSLMFLVCPPFPSSFSLSLPPLSGGEGGRVFHCWKL